MRASYMTRASATAGPFPLTCRLLTCDFCTWRRLRSAGFARRRGLPGATTRLSFGLPLCRRLVALVPAHPLRGRFETVPDALCFRLGGFLVRALFLGGPWVVLAAHELHLRDFGGIAPAESYAQN